MPDQAQELPNYFAEMITSFIHFLPSLISALVIFFLGLYLSATISRSVVKAMERRNANTQITLLLKRLTHWSLLTLVTIVALQQVGFNLTAFLTGLGIVGFTIGFALQDVSKNFIAGVLLLMDQPFQLGDVVTIIDFTGSIESISMRATVMKTLDGQFVMIPNADVLTNPIINVSRATQRRVDITVGIDYDSDLEIARQTALEVIRTVPGFVETPAPQVIFQNFGPSTLDMTIFYWIDTSQTNPAAAKDAGIVIVKRAFDQAGIEMPFPTQTLRFQSLPTIPPQS